MIHLILEPNFDGLLEMILAIMFGPSIVLVIIGLLLRKNNKKAAKVFFILAAVYAIVSLGICGTMMAGF